VTCWESEPCSIPARFSMASTICGGIMMLRWMRESLFFFAGMVFSVQGDGQDALRVRQG